MAKKSKVPVREVASDSLAVVVGDETYHPHVGEVVRFRSSGSVGQLAAALDLQSLRFLSAEDPEQAARLAGRLDQVVDALVAGIASWTWTDDEGEAYPPRPTQAILRGLSVQEVTWLLNMQAGAPPPRTEDEEKKGS